MSPGDRPGGRARGGPATEELLDGFDRAWRDGTAPRIESVVAALSGPTRRALLEELVRIDLEYRWRQADRATSRLPTPLLEVYVAQFPELGPPARLPVDFIAYEYRVRRHWGDRPGREEYAARFPEQGAALPALLERVDAELAMEFGAVEVALPPAHLPPTAAAPALPAGGAAGVIPVGEFIDALRATDVLGTARLNDLILADLHGNFPDARALGASLIERAWLTPFQANLFLRGRGAEAVQDAYVLLERLGQGGAGQVFKARHRHMDRVVALKLIRRDHINDREIVSRFQREIKVISQLAHPNVVQAFDAGPCGTNYFLAMEYVEGTDLAKLVKERGPLSVEQACEFVKQAAVGLQHIHERGLVHRDIKPSNLLVSGGVVSGEGATLDSPLTTHLIKILDLGLARVQESSGAEAGGPVSAAGAVMMGTIDYMAPEQALDFHGADVRADIYSLGCTLFFLLTGRPPFGQGTLAQKLLRHQRTEPPLDQVPSGVPAAAAAVLRRMLAKRPEDRYQTAAEVVEALVAAVPGLLSASTSSSTPLPRAMPVPEATPVVPEPGTRPRLARGALGGAAVGGGLLVVLALWAGAAFTGPAGKDSGKNLVVATGPIRPEPTRPRTAARPTTEGAVVEKVLQGRGAIQDVLLDPVRPETALGGEARYNPVQKHEESGVFLVRFDLDKLGLPRGARVEKATLSIFVWDLSDSKAETRLDGLVIRTPWEESQACWRRPKAGVKWQGGASFRAGDDCDPACTTVRLPPDDLFGMPRKTPLEFPIDVTAAVRAWHEGWAPNYGLALTPVADRSVDGGVQTRFQLYASESPTIAWTPKLTVRAWVPAAGR